MQDFEKCLNNFERNLSDLIEKKRPSQLNLNFLRTLNRVKGLLEEIHFLPELYGWGKAKK